MTETSDPSGGTVVDSFYVTGDVEQTREKYDSWANGYEADLFKTGYRLPWVLACAVAQHVSKDEGPILDAGCGGGLQAEPLRLLGYHSITGADLSENMLEIARQKGLYERYVTVTLGETLPFETDEFVATLTCGVITPGHAPASSFDELIRVTRPGGKLFLTLRDDPGQLPEYPEKIAALTEAGAWREIFKTPSFASMPLGDMSKTHRIHIFEVLI